ncbi:GUN4 domain-containing protein [Roseofilum sp. Guam]|uniref:GUN4 domain-containing protein n=1 Tax=Roseofilum sp. Guam TaxID=2821502 RepID=UPI001B0AE84D|nr:GUN4 domain-containing protein [Roseofilum sp. Guam]MBP0027308.1 GUN4 domain-containing protein [Roseofilum sp. Guam]
MVRILHIQLTPVGKDQARFQFFWDNPNQFEPRFLALSEIEELLQISETDYYTLIPLSYPETGEELFNWLDGNDRLLQSALNESRTKHRGEQIVLAISTSGKLANLPWEILHDGTKFLVQYKPPIVPVRWVTEGLDGERLIVKEEAKPRFLNMVFMACSPQDVKPVLDFEAEEGQILMATKGITKDLCLTVEESGCLEEFQEIFNAEEDPFDVVHLTGHATTNGKKPYFLTEDEYGYCQKSSTADIAKTLQLNYPKLVFLSGCQTGYSRSSANQTVLSMAEELVLEGAPAVLGWGDRIQDKEASAVAATLYRELSAGQTLVQALGLTYQGLLGREGMFNLLIWDSVSGQGGYHQWHLLRLYAACLPGALVTKPKNRKRRRQPAPPSNTKNFIPTREQESPLGPKEFVGRRRQLQNCLRSLKMDEDKVGVLLTGMGGWGKSAIAARLCQRLLPWFKEPIVWTWKEQPINEQSIVSKLSDELEDATERQLLQGQEELKYRLRNLFAASDSQPFLLVLDDFEQNLELISGQYRLKPETARVLRALVWAMQRTNAGHRMIITCRYQFQSDLLEGFFIQPLESFHHADLLKILQRLPHFNSEENRELIPRALTLASGNPRLLKKINDEVLAQENAEELLAQWETHPEQWKYKVIWEALNPLIDKPLAKILSTCLVYRIHVPMAALEAVCEGQLSSREEERDQIRRAMALGLIEISYHLEEDQREYRVSQNLSQIFSAVRLSEDTDKLYPLYQKAWTALTQLWANIGNQNQEQWQQIFRLKFADKGNPERFREGFEQMRYFLSSYQADRGLERELRKAINELSREALCERLENLLQQERWYEANEETTFIFYQVMVLEEEEDFYDLYRNFPREPLQAINQLWLKYSHGQFGFSVQKEIWLDLGGKLGEYDYDTYKKLAKRVGWYKHGSYLSYPSEYSFNTNSLGGYLPHHGGGVIVLQRRVFMDVILHFLLSRL